MKLVSTHPDDMPLNEGMERVVAEITEVATRAQVDAYVAGFKLGVLETLRLLRETGQYTLAPEGVDELLARWDQTDEEATE